MATTGPPTRLPHTQGWWVGTMGDLAKSSVESVVGRLSAAAAKRGLPVTREQHAAWEIGVGALQETSRSVLALDGAEQWGVILEFELPRRAVRPDAVVLAREAIIPIEIKAGADRFERAARMQSEEYARDLNDFHEPSHGREIVPVLVATEASREDVDLDAECLLDRAQCVNPDGLGELLREIYARNSSDAATQLDAREWSSGRYRPSPGIIQAALDVYSGNEVRDLSLTYADNLGATVDAIRNVISDAREHGRRNICFVTGVPGSGKTLAGLTAVHDPAAGADAAALGAYLSGNGPLVKVLRYAVASDLRRRRGVRIQEAERIAGTFIQPVHRFVEELGLSSTPPPEHVIVFDEAQRAWDSVKMERKQRIPASEAETTLSIMERVNDWAVVVALIGEGQEIHDGEAGIEEWLEALRVHDGWRVYASPAVGAKPYQLGSRLREREELHLSVSVRSPRAQAIADWAGAVISGRLAAAARIAAECEGFPLLLTRDLDTMRDYLRDRERPDRRIGLIASSQARRLRPFGIEMDSAFQGGIPWERWFVDQSDDFRSSYSLEVAASEFKCQGLEIDWAGLCWGSDFTWDTKTADWQVLRLRGARWVADRDRIHAMNRYRVLLTRARYGLVIWVPLPKRQTHLVDGDALERTAEALLEAGCAYL